MNETPPQKTSAAHGGESARQPAEPTGHISQGDVTGLAAFLRDPLQRSIAITVLVVLATLYTLYFARIIVVPIVLAAILSTMLMPSVRRLHRLHVPMALSAALILLALLLILFFVGYWLSEPAADWLGRLPESLRKAEFKIRELTGSVESLSATTDQVSRIAESITDSKVPALKVEVQETTVTSFLLSWTQEVAAGIGITAILLYFLLASDNSFLRKLVRVIPSWDDKKRAVDIVRQVQEDIARYFVTITLINMALGLAIGLLAYFVGLNNPIILGIMAGLLNFIPYIGALIGVGVVGVIGLLHFDSVAPALLTMGAYLAITSLEGSIVTPSILGRRLSLSPVVVIIGLMVFTTIWGTIGTLLTVPILASMKIVCDRVDALNPFSEFLGR
jgi:predicted PurR-regulated permease PerM